MLPTSMAMRFRRRFGRAAGVGIDAERIVDGLLAGFGDGRGAFVQRAAVGAP